MNEWIPSEEITSHANISKWMHELNCTDVATFHHWSYSNPDLFWQKVVNTLPICFKTNPTKVCDLSRGVIEPRWFPGGTLNIVDSCFQAAPTKTAFIFQNENQQLQEMTYGDLHLLVKRVSASLVNAGYQAGDAIALMMPMHPLACAIYLAIINMGGVVVSIADSFSPKEIATRLRIAKAKTLITQETTVWAGKTLALYDKIKIADPEKIILVKMTNNAEKPRDMRTQDVWWDDFLVSENEFTSVAREPMDACHILFSSGTTADPKAIPWNHTTPIRVASDAYFHQNIQTADVLAWPTNLGWMMGPWVLFAALINQASLALYVEAPKDRAFGQFIQDAKVTLLGVVPTLVATWKHSACMEGLDFSHLKAFSSTGECSNELDMSYLMSLAGNKPIIEYCGGTEIGGAYLSSTVVQANYPSQFSTPTMGTRIAIINEQGVETSQGEVAIIPPTIGLSTSLLNADHIKVYFDNMPKAADGSIMRRHGDQIERLKNGYYRILGRVDDSMNLGGIKVSAAEIERALADFPGVNEVAAVAHCAAGGGPNQLVIFAASSDTLADKKTLQAEMQKCINTNLNPLFRIHDVMLVKELPKTASNKIMRRTLRDSLN